jgi:NhaA family Na+:H+ antiporter
LPQESSSSSTQVTTGRPRGRHIVGPLREYLQTEASGGIVLLVAAAVALVWANLPLAETYESFWRTELTLRLGERTLSTDLRHWVNDALMTIFFFVVALEIKRELTHGEISERKRATLPVVAALGGMVVPALLYLVFNAGGEGASGWGIPMATDIAFAIGVLALLGRRIPSALKVFLLTLAIVDDIGAILVIAIVYTSDIQLGALAAAGGLVAVMAAMRSIGITWVPAYAVVGVAAWLATFESGVHATIAGVAIGLLTPAHEVDADITRALERVARELRRKPSPPAARAAVVRAKGSVSPAERLEHFLHPWASFLVVPVFALANAGIPLGTAGPQALGSEVALGVVAGLVVGKLAGILGAVWLALRLRVGELPQGVGNVHVAGAAALAGIGFTVSLFMTELAFSDAGVVNEAKIGILAASLISSLLGALILAKASTGAGPNEGDD